MESQGLISLPRIISDEGSGRSFVTIFDATEYAELGRVVSQRISQRARSVLVVSPGITAQNWQLLAKGLTDLLAAAGVRQASFVGLGAGAALVENLALENPKMVRTLVVVDSTLRPHPSRWERLVDKLEEKLPFGLPLRLGSRGFNVKAYAHRLRCPILVVETRRASGFVKSELQSLSQTAPTAWHVALRAGDDQGDSVELSDLVWAFQDTPAKCPQKNLQEAV